MKKKNIIRKNQEFNDIIQKKKAYRNKYLIIYYIKKDKPPYRFGISVSKKLGNAVFRNKNKRQTKAILDQKIFPKPFDCIIILRKPYVDLTYQEKDQVLTKSLNDLKMLDGGKN